MDSLFEQLSSIETMIEAEQEIIALGDAAIPLLKTLFDGSARNEWGVSYRELGLPLRCGFEIIMRLGSRAKPLEPYIHIELPGSEAAARALRALRELTPPSVEALADALEGDFNVAREAAFALIACGQDRSPPVESVVERSREARELLETARRLPGQQFPSLSSL